VLRARGTSDMGAQAHISARLPSYVRATSMAVVGKPVRGSECFSPYVGLCSWRWGAMGVVRY